MESSVPFPYLASYFGFIIKHFNYVFDFQVDWSRVLRKRHYLSKCAAVRVKFIQFNCLCKF